MGDRERLNQWMEQNRHNCRTLAEMTGETRQSVYGFTSGNRPISDGFKWRFAAAFGLDQAQRVFADASQAEPLPGDLIPV